MPIITISLYPGRTEEQKKIFAAEVTEMAVKILKTKREHVIIVFEENSKENWFMNGENL